MMDLLGQYLHLPVLTPDCKLLEVAVQSYSAQAAVDSKRAYFHARSYLSDCENAHLLHYSASKPLPADSIRMAALSSLC